MIPIAIKIKMYDCRNAAELVYKKAEQQINFYKKSNSEDFKYKISELEKLSAYAKGQIDVLNSLLDD